MGAEIWWFAVAVAVGEMSQLYISCSYQQVGMFGATRASVTGLEC